MRKTVFALAFLIAGAGAAPAFADAPRWDNEAFVKASACGAYGSLRSLAADGVDVSAIVARVNAEMRNKNPDVQKRASRQVRNAVAAEMQGTALSELRERRDRLCATFIAPTAQAALR